MCNKLCTYRKYIVGNSSGEYNLTENPHIILAARENQGLANNFIGLTPINNALTNLSTTNFHLFYLGAYYSWTDWVSGILGTQTIVPTPSVFTDNGTYDAFNSFGVQVTLPQTMATNYPTYNIVSIFPSTAYKNWSIPPLDFADNISSDQYVAGFTYQDTDLGISNPLTTYLLVEFLDVTGMRCKNP
jgi:hypothetical protein